MAANISSISMALAADAAKIHIPKPSGISSSDWKGPAHGLAVGAQTGLPTPPNSISPNLPAHGMAARARHDAAAASSPPQVDSDIELGDAIDSVPGIGHPLQHTHQPSDYSHITSALIARDYLPAIVVGKGQVAVKDVINSLTRDLPGFIDIPPAKARRIVVGALETRNGGLDGNVEFEKTGWGRWVGRAKPQTGRRESKTMHTIVEGRTTSPIDIGSVRRASGWKIRRDSRRLSHGSLTHDSTSGSDQYDRLDTDVFHNDMDEMLIDGEQDHFNRYAGPRAVRAQDTGSLSDTDEEDWASMGAEALRVSSYQSRSGPWRHHRRTSRRSSTRSPFPDMGRSAPTHDSTQWGRSRDVPALDFTGVDADDQERAAIEALMRMGSA